MDFTYKIIITVSLLSHSGAIFGTFFENFQKKLSNCLPNYFWKAFFKSKGIRIVLFRIEFESIVQFQINATDSFKRNSKCLKTDSDFLKVFQSSNCFLHFYNNNTYKIVIVSLLSHFGTNFTKTFCWKFWKTFRSGIILEKHSSSPNSLVFPRIKSNRSYNSIK